MTLSVCQLYFAELLSMNYKLKAMWREAAKLYLRNYPVIWEGTKENQLELRIVSVHPKIRTGHVSNTSHKKH